MQTSESTPASAATDAIIGAFDQHRPLLFSLAYRMLGSVADAEDVVQDAFVRVQAIPADGIQSPRDYLCSVVTRLSIDYLRSARVRREEYVGPWLPEPLLRPVDEDPLASTILAESLSTAFLLILERLSEVERAVYLLREAFSFDYAEVARITGKSEAACRQIAKRARDRIAEQRPRFSAAPDDAEALALRFMETCARGDIDSLLALLTDDAVACTDGGGKVLAARNPILGADRVARFFVGVARKWPGVRTRIVSVNGSPWIVVRDGHGGVQVISLAVRDGRIGAVYVVANPSKLERIPDEVLRSLDAPGD